MKCLNQLDNMTNMTLALVIRALQTVKSTFNYEQLSNLHVFVVQFIIKNPILTLKLNISHLFRGKIELRISVIEFYFFYLLGFVDRL